MDLSNLNFDLATIEAFILVFFRVGSIVWAAPVFGSETVMGPVKICFALIITIMVWPLVSITNFIFIDNIFAYILAIGKEIAIGVLIGYFSIILFSAIRFAGEMVGQQMGLAIANVLDPMSDEQISVVSQFQYFLALILFLLFNMHHIYIKAIFRTFELVPLLGFNPSGSLIQHLIRLTSELFVIAMKLCAPGVAMLLVITAGMGIVSKAVPAINILIAGFPIRIAAGLIGIAVGLPLYTYVMQKMFLNMMRNLEVLINCFV